jgi:hypothetical protein
MLRSREAAYYSNNSRQFKHKSHPRPGTGRLHAWAAGSEPRVPLHRRINRLHFGHPAGAAWPDRRLLDTRGLGTADSFAISADIPEPSAFALTLPALCMADLMAARRCSKG